MKDDAAFKGFSPRTIKFMWELGLNNEKPWFEAHKAEFQQEFQLPMKALGRAVFDKISKKYGDRGFIHKVSRIYRDARYLRPGDGPYRTGMWVSVERPTGAEWTDHPVFWFDLGPENWSYGMGYGGAKAETMAKFRARIDKDPKKFERLTAFLGKQTEFVLDGDEYARKKEAPTKKTAAWYNKKSFSLIHRQPNGDELFSPDLADRVAEGMMSLMPLYDYLATLDSDPAPEI
jgi:uncharacterized protein (TIGR02453 family)